MRFVLAGLGALAALGVAMAAHGGASRAAPGMTMPTSATFTPSATPPRRVVSINPCVDAMLHEMADDSQIVAISHYSQMADSTSVPLDWARRFPVTQDAAEEVMAMKPDLVIAGGHVARSTLLMLQRMGIPMLQVPVAQTIAMSRQQVMEVASALGHPERGVALNARIDAALAHAAPPRGGKPVPALIWQAGGMVPGTGTLADELLSRTGFHNRSAEYGLAMWDVLSLERLLAAPPEMLLTSGAMAEHGDRQLRHPALRGLARQIRVEEFAPRLLHCAGPSLIPAAERLAQLRRGAAL